MFDLHEMEQLLGKARVAEIRASVVEVLRIVLANPSRYSRHGSAADKNSATLLGATHQVS